MSVTTIYRAIVVLIIVGVAFGFQWTQHCNNPQGLCTTNSTLAGSIRASPYATQLRQDVNIWYNGGTELNEPVMDSNRNVYYVRHLHYLRGLNSFTNQPIWENSTLSNDNFTSTPVIVNGLAIIPGQLYLYAYDMQYGNIAWLFKPNGYTMFNATNYPVVDSNGNVIVTGYVAPGTKAVISFKPTSANYSINWQCILPDSYIVTSPAVMNNDETLVYVAGYNTTVLDTPSLGWYALSATTGAIMSNATFLCFFGQCTSIGNAFVSQKGLFFLIDMGGNPTTHVIDPVAKTMVNVPAMVYVTDANNILYGNAQSATIVAYNMSANGSVQTVWSSNSAGGEYALATSMGVIEGSVLYVALANVIDSHPSLLLVAYDIHSGAILWSLPFSYDSNIDSSPPIVEPDGTIWIRMGPNFYNISCCSGQGSCNVGNECVCNENYYGNNCSVFCTVSSCSFPNAMCTADGCACQDNYYPSQNCTVFCNQTQCASSHYNNAACSSVGECVCLPNYYGSECQTFCNSPTTCFGNGVCTSNGTCSCNEHYYGKNCTVMCENGVFSEANYTCSCNENYYGPACNAFCDPATSCSGKGNCSATGSCVCEANYFGSTCAVFCDSNSCSEHGSCNSTTGLCNCMASYFGGNCTYFCEHGTFLSNNTCSCNANYYGDGCTTFCEASTSCSGQGTCVASTGNCSCNVGYYTSNCGVFCDKGHFNNGTCACDVNYYGSSCTTFCSSNVTCSGNGACTSEGTCECNSGHKGTDCSSNSANNSNMPKPAVWIGVGVGVGAFVVVVGVASFLFIRRNRKRHDYTPISH